MKNIDISSKTTLLKYTVSETVENPDVVIPEQKKASHIV